MNMKKLETAPDRGGRGAHRPRSCRLRNPAYVTTKAKPCRLRRLIDASDALAAKLAECRSVTYEQKDALSECRKAWAEKRRQFLGQKAPSASSDNGPPQEGSSLFVPPKDESRLSPGYPPIQQSGKE